MVPDPGARATSPARNGRLSGIVGRPA